MHRPVAPPIVACVLGVCLLASGCSAGPAGTPASSQAPSIGPSGSPTGSPAPSASPASSGVVDASSAAAAVAAINPLFAGISQRDPNLIGQGSWWEATPLIGYTPGSWQVVYQIGWGDCQSGCIDHHTWTYQVAPDGNVTLVSEEGSALASDVLTERAAAATWTGVGGVVTAGPTCPVERPGDSACAPRPVDGARLQVTDAGGVEVGQVTADASGLFRLDLPPGDYVLVPQPVEGLLGTASSMPFTVRQGGETFLQVDYDTGIR